MGFDKEHKTIIETLNIIEAEEYLEFLRRERSRHYETFIRLRVRVGFLASEVLRQREEIIRIDERIEQVRKRFLL